MAAASAPVTADDPATMPAIASVPVEVPSVPEAVAPVPDSVIGAVAPFADPSSRADEVAPSAHESAPSPNEVVPAPDEAFAPAPPSALDPRNALDADAPPAIPARAWPTRPVADGRPPAAAVAPPIVQPEPPPIAQPEPPPIAQPEPPPIVQPEPPSAEPWPRLPLRALEAPPALRAGSPPTPPPAANGPDRELTLILVEDVEEVTERVRELLRSQSMFRLVAVVTDGRRVEQAVAEHRPDVVLVDTLLQGWMKGPAVIERLRRARSPVPCVAIAIAERPLDARTEGNVDAVLTLPFGTFDLVRAIRAASTAGAARNPTLASRVVAIFSAKGGVGKTTLAVNLAVALRATGLRTALVDGSLQYADVRRLLGAPADLPSILDMPTDSVRASDLEEVMVPGPAGVDLLLAPPRLEQAELVSTRDVDKIVDMLRRTYHAVVIDTPSSLGETTLALLDTADVILQVVTPETAALGITRLVADAFAGIGYPPAKLQLLLNRADAQSPIDPGAIHRVFGRDPDHVVASDWSVVALCNARGEPFVVAAPEARISADVRAVADRVAGVVGAAPRDLPARRERAAYR